MLILMWLIVTMKGGVPMLQNGMFTKVIYIWFWSTATLIFTLFFIRQEYPDSIQQKSGVQ